MYKAYEVINPIEGTFIYVFLVYGLELPKEPKYNDHIYLKDITDREVFNITEYEYGSQYITINTREKIHYLYNEIM